MGNDRTIRLQAYFTIFMILTSWLCIYGSGAQVTFSKNWSPGKRSHDQEKQFKFLANALCRFLVNQVRTMSTCHGGTEGDPIDDSIEDRR